MGALDSFLKTLGEKQEEEEEKKQPTQSAAMTSFYAALGEEPKEQTSKPASASDYDSLQLPTPQQYADRIGTGIKKAIDWVAALPAVEEKTTAAGKPAIQPVEKQQDDFSHKSGKLDEGPTQRYYDMNKSAQRAKEREAAALAPTSDMYLNPVTAAAAKDMQAQSDKAREEAAEYEARAENSKPDIVKQREKTEQARNELLALAYSNNTPEGVKKYEEKLAEFNEENEKLHEMGGRFGLKEDTQTTLENLGAGAVSSLRGIVNALGYAGQEMTRGQLMEQQSVMAGLPGQQEIADSSAKTLEELQQRGLQGYADPALDLVQKAANAVKENRNKAVANQRAGAFRLAGMDDEADKIEETAKNAATEDVMPWSERVNNFIQRAAEHTAASGKVTKALASTANGVGGMVPSILSNIAVPGSGMWVMAAQAAGNATEDALAKGANDELAVLYGGAVAAVEVLTEKMFGGIPGLGIGAADEILEKAVKANVGSEAAQRAILFLLDALGEGVEEFASEFADYGIDRWLIKSDDRSLNEVRKDAWYSAMIGALTSVAMQLPAETVKRMGPKQVAQMVAQEAQNRMQTEAVKDLKAAKTRTADDLALPNPAEVAGNEKTAPEGTARDLKLPTPGEAVGNQNTVARAEKTADSIAEAVNNTPYEVRRDADGNVYIEISADILKGKPESEWKRTVRQTIQKIFGTGIKLERGYIYSNKTGRGEFTNGSYSRMLERTDPEMYQDKLRMAAGSDGIVANAENIKYEDASHNRNDDIVGFNRGNINVSVKGNGYSGDVLTGVYSDGKETFFDINNLARRQITEAESPERYSDNGITQTGETTSATDRIPQPAQNVKTGLELPEVQTQEQGQTAQPQDLSLPSPEQVAKGTTAQQQAEPKAQEQARDLRLPSPQELAQDDSWRREETREEEAARREAEEREYRAQRAAEDEEAEMARLEREGKKMEETPVPKAPKSRTELKKQLQKIFSIQEGSKGVVNEIADGIADRLQKGQDLSEDLVERLFDAVYERGSYTQQADDYFRNFRDTVKGTRIYVSPEVRAEFGDDWKSFASRARKAGITLTSDVNAGGIDVHAGELAQIYRTIDAEGTDLAAQLEKIVDTAERGRPQTLTAAEMEDVLRGEYGDQFIEERTAEMARKFRQALEVFKQSSGIEADARAKADAKIQKMQDNAKALAKKQMERRALHELQNKTLKQLQWLSKNRNKMGAEFQARADDVLRDIDTIAINAANEMHIDKASGKTWRDLADIYEEAKKNDPNFLPSKQLDDIVKRLNNKKIGDMDIGALQDLYKAAVGLRTEYYNRNNVIGDELHQTFSEAYHASVDEINAAKGTPKGETKAAKWFNREQLTPINYLRSLVGWKNNSTFASFGKQLESGERAYKKYIVDATKSLESFMKDHAEWVRKADGQGKDAIWYEYEIPAEFARKGIGEPVTYSDKMVKVYMTPAQKVHLALEAENYDNLRHMEGGRTFVDKDLYSKGKRSEAFAAGTTVKMTPEWAKKISSDLTPEEKALKNALSKYYNEYSKGEINRVSNILYGYDKAIAGSYAPIYTNDNYVGHQPGITDSTAEGVGHLKSRQVSKNPSYNISAFDAFERHTDQNARFVGYSIPIRNMNTLMNWRTGDTTLRDEIDHKWKGADANKYIDDLLTNLQSTRYNETGSVQGLVNQLLSNYISSVFGANPGIVLKQAASFPQAAAILGYKTMPSPKQLAKVDTELIGKYTPELDYRTLGYATPETATLKNNPGLLQRNKALNFLFGGGAITAMDGATVRSIWPWAENYVAQNFPSLQKGTQEQIDAGESPFYKKVAEVFNEAVNTTQPMYDTMHRAKIMTTKDGADRALTMFKTVPLQQYNTLRQAFGELQAAKQSDNPAERKAASRKAANAVTATLASTAMLEGIELLNQAWKNGAKNYRDDDDELTAESVGKEFAERAVKDLAGLTVGGSQLSELIFNKLNGRKWYGIEIPGGEQLNDVIDTFTSAAEAATKFVSDGADVLKNGGDLGEYYKRHGGEYAKALKDTAEKFAMYFKGLPVQNVEKYLGGALRIAAPELYAEIGDLLDTPDRAALKKTADNMIPTRINDMLDQRLGGVPEGSAEELARLYQKYGGSVALPDIPTSITIKKDDDTTESKKLSAYDQQIYEKALTGALRIPLAGLETDKEFQALDDDEKEDYLKRLYSAAADWAKYSVDNAAGGSYSEKIMALRRAGANMTAIMQSLAMKAATSPAEFAALVEDGRFKGDALKAAKEVLGVQSEYDNLKDAGLKDQEIFAVADAIDAIEGEKNKWKKLDAIAGLDLPQESIDKAASVYLSESQYKAWQKSGMELSEYADAAERAARINNHAEGVKDEDGETIKGSKQLEVMMGINSLDLKPQEKSALMASMGYNEKQPIWYTRYNAKDYEAFYYMSDSRRKEYKENAASWMSPSEFAEYVKIDDNAKGEKDLSGETISGSKKLEVMEEINALKMPALKKTQIMEALGYDMDGEGKAAPIWDTDYSAKDYEAYYYMSDGQRKTYEKYCDWMPVADYTKYADSISDFHDIKNDKGKTTTSRKSQVIAYIDALDLTPDQKTALYVAVGYNANLTDKGFADCPWWNRLALRSEYYPVK